jgi:hypothetical protein
MGSWTIWINRERPLPTPKPFGLTHIKRHECPPLKNCTHQRWSSKSVECGDGSIGTNIGNNDSNSNSNRNRNSNNHSNIGTPF